VIAEAASDASNAAIAPSSSGSTIRLIYTGHDLFTAHDVNLDGQTARTKSVNLGCHFIQLVLRSRCHGYVGARLSHRERDRSADTASATGNQRPSAF